MFGTPTDDLEAEIAKSRQKLTEFEDGASWRDLVARLQRASPMHPFLVFRTACAGLFGLCVVALLLVLIGSVFSRDVAEVVNSIETALFLPMPVVFGFLAIVFAGGAVVSYVGAISAGRQAAYLPHEAKVHQRLLSEVQQLEAKRHVKERMTPKPATPRLLDRRGRS